MQLRRGRSSSTERRLRAARPAAPEDLVRRLAAQATPMRNLRAPRFAVAGVATAVMLVGLAAIGGVGRAASELHHVVNVATGQTNDFGTHLAVQLDQQSAARAQYNPTPTTTGNTTKALVPANTPSNFSTPTSTFTGTFPNPVVVSLTNGLPSGSTSTATLSSSKTPNVFTSLSVTSTNGQPVNTFQQAVSISMSFPSGGGTSDIGGAGGFLPSTSAVVWSSDGGTTMNSVSYCRDGSIPTGQLACYSINIVDDTKAGTTAAAGSQIVIHSLVPGTFGIVYKANITKSESGRTVPQAGSGKFGDPTRNHVGAPVMKQIGSKIAPMTSLQSTKVPFDFSVDEQAAVYISIYDAKGMPVWIHTTGTKVRGHAYSGKAVHALHFVVLRPGRINTLLNVPAGMLKAGQTYKLRITAVDFDGHKVTEYTTFTG